MSDKKRKLKVMYEPGVTEGGIELEDGFEKDLRRIARKWGWGWYASGFHFESGMRDIAFDKVCSEAEIKEMGKLGS